MSPRDPSNMCINVSTINYPKANTCGGMAYECGPRYGNVGKVSNLSCGPKCENVGDVNDALEASAEARRCRCKCYGVVYVSEMSDAARLYSVRLG